MADQKRKRRNALEPIDDIPDVLAGRDAAAQQSPRPKRRRGRDRSWDAQRSKATYDLPSELIDRIREVAEELGGGEAKVKVSDVARLLLEAGLAQYESGELKIKPKPTGYSLFDD